MTRLLVSVVRLYQLLCSPWLGSSCRFEPTCSAYAITALERHGAVRGSWLGIRRILRCNPLHPGGIDPVPPCRSSSPISAAWPTENSHE
ncbi:membrane protein insertion efficiency factor YidD [Candidatus Symbiobacter mobilis]|uniref:Putative membrane protein insertion efficiency factor n=1 Tax=Candidatus Symbiobacter mobilis CR TaxID=946483 RepID=U5NEU8_9BURK|nr:membrane protein insertion efficiency factor YidD [Candidatus Symbiobacter mobilis]AGX88763.1 hypothetical protein Cenrod_2717 [Candidatus Symbiobacter mobilis CR]